MQVRYDVLAAIGDTPLIKLRRASEETGCEILGKAEFMNPGASVKDRAAKAIIEQAMAEGRLERGGIVVDGTAGNTGIGLAMVGDALGLKTVIVIPDTQSQEKKDALRLLGAELIEVPAVPYKNPNNYVKVSGRLAEQLAKSEPNGAIWANQFDNVANREGHIRTTAEEIWQQTDGRIDAFVQSVGTAHSIHGVTHTLWKHNPKIRIVAVEPAESAVLSGKPSGSHKIEGIGIGFTPPLWQPERVNEIQTVTTEEARGMARRLAREEGIFAGVSTGANVVAAIRVARSLGPSAAVATIIVDSGLRYLSTDVYRDDPGA